MSKPRPDNTPGSNGLRGGLKTYSIKTVTGNWLEDHGGTAGYRRGFTTPEFETESQHQQLGVTLRPPKDFGGDLPNNILDLSSSITYKDINEAKYSPAKKVSC